MSSLTESLRDREGEEIERARGRDRSRERKRDQERGRGDRDRRLQEVFSVAPSSTRRLRTVPLFRVAQRRM
ncbi:hypothetical protein ACB092_02G184600 [Castanea dentata]